MAGGQCSPYWLTDFMGAGSPILWAHAMRPYIGIGWVSTSLNPTEFIAEVP